jgi:hypothetical protein
MHSIRTMALLVALIAVTPMFSWAAEQREPVYMGKPLSYWIESLRNRDEEMKLAFAAIDALGPDAESAVPELVRIVSEPFTAIWVGTDKREQVATKVANIQLRADAVDALGAIGAPAAASTPSLIQWALMVRVVPMDVTSREEEELYVDLIAIDVLERMRVAGAVALFGKSALLPVAMSLASKNDDERKLAVAILSEHAPPIAAALLKSENCESRKLGIAILMDMWPVVSADHIRDLAGALTCGVRTVY